MQPGTFHNLSKVVNSPITQTRFVKKLSTFSKKVYRFIKEAGGTQGTSRMFNPGKING